MDQWDQLFSDRPVRRQIDLQDLVIGVIDEELLRPLILSTYIIPKGVTFEQQVKAMLPIIAVCGKQL